jgi:single-stranded-DNA-specific exonuclease
MNLTKDEILKKLESRNLNNGYSKLADIPHYSSLKDIDKGAKRIADAIRNKESLKLCADYDGDGILSCATAISFFQDIGYPLEWTIPNRFTEGYGVSPKIIDRLSSGGVLFTLDNGIVVSEDVIKKCNEKNIDLIICDHHTPGPALPNCYAVINPKRKDCEYPLKEISGCFVGWLLFCAIKHELNLDIDMRKYLDFVALSTITDMMPLLGINRYLVLYGLKLINGMRRPFFKEIALERNINKFTYDDLGWILGPLLNAAGRMEDASLAVEALLANEKEVANQVRGLVDLNILRKSLQNDMIERARKVALDQKHFIIVALDDLHEGIVGIVAARIAEDMGFPTIILTLDENGLLKGSGRSVGTVNIYDLIHENKSFLERSGGHAGACGLSLNPKNLKDFTNAIKDSASKLDSDQFLPIKESFGELSLKEATIELFYQIEEFAPFGEKNPLPIFECKKAMILSSKAIGTDGNHVRLLLNWEDQDVYIMAFNSDITKYPTGTFVSFKFSLNLNEWNGNIKLQFMPIGEVKVL